VYLSEATGGCGEGREKMKSLEEGWRNNQVSTHEVQVIVFIERVEVVIERSGDPIWWLWLEGVQLTSDARLDELKSADGPVTIEECRMRI
jgi:hypothetical protein